MRRCAAYPAYGEGAGGGCSDRRVDKPKAHPPKGSVGSPGHCRMMRCCAACPARGEGVGRS